MDTIIIIPAYNPDESLLSLVKELKGYFRWIIIVNDGSEQKCGQIFESLQTEHGCVILNHYVNMGKGRALKTAFNYCIKLCSENKIAGVITADADGQHNMDSILRINKAMCEYPANFILGVRSFLKDVPFRSRFGNNVTKYVFQWLCGIHISDTQTGLRGIPVQYLGLCCGIDGEKYEYETNMLLMTKTEMIEITEVPIDTIYENNNATSHFNPLIDSFKIYQTILLYSLSSIIAVLIDFFTFGILINSGLGVLLSTYVGRLFSACANFTINRKVVFKSTSNCLKQLFRYGGLVLLSGTISGCLIRLL